MAVVLPLLLGLSFLFLTLSRVATAISTCSESCGTLNGCAGQLICIGGKCNDDPDIVTHICQNGGTSTPRCCQPFKILFWQGKPHPQYSCSPLVTSSTRAKLTNNDFRRREGSSPSECDGQYHSNFESVVALPTGWYSGHSRCSRLIRIAAGNGKSTTAKVMDECDSHNGCDQEHAFHPPCRNNIADASDAVWRALGLNIANRVKDVTWSMV